VGAGSGAGGGLGSLLVQLAHGAGGRVIAAARGGRKLALARDLGADAALDYSQPGWTQQVREATGGAGVGVVFDGVGDRLAQTLLGRWQPAGGSLRTEHRAAGSRERSIPAVVGRKYGRAENGSRSSVLIHD